MVKMVIDFCKLSIRENMKESDKLLIFYLPCNLKFEEIEKSYKKKRQRKKETWDSHKRICIWRAQKILHLEKKNLKDPKKKMY